MDNMLRRYLSILFASVISLHTILLQAEEPDSIRVRKISTVEVKAKRITENTASSPYQMIEKKDIDLWGLKDVSDALRRLVGVTVKDYGGIGGLKTVSIRNIGAQHTAVCYDGIAVGDVQSGQVDVGRFSLDNLSSIALTIGQQDNIFQPARNLASVGTVFLQSMPPQFVHRNYGVECMVRGGSYGLFQPRVYYTQKISSTMALSVYGDYLRADGNYPFYLENGNSPEKRKRINSDIESGRGEVNLYGNFHKWGTLSVKAYYFASQRGLPGSVTLYNPISKERLWDKNYFAQAKYETALGKYFSLLVNGKYNYAYNRYIDGEIADDRYSQWEGYASAALKYVPLRTLTFSLSSDFISNYLENNLITCVYPHRYTSLTAMSAQYKNGRLSATATVLYTHVTENVRSGTVPADRDQWSPSFSVSVLPWKEYNFKLRAFYKEIYRLPTFSDLYYPRAGNRKLEPENARQLDLGFTWWKDVNAVWQDVSLSCDGYYNKVTNKIIAIPRQLFIWSMTNVGKVDMAGCDVTFSSSFVVTPRYKFVLAANYSYQYAVDVTDNEKKTYRHQIAYAPTHSGSTALSFENPWVNVAYTMPFSGMRYSLNENIPENRIEAYCDHNLTLSREFTLKWCRVGLQVDASNLSNKNYEIIRWYPMPGRSFRATLRVII